MNLKRTLIIFMTIITILLFSSANCLSPVKEDFNSNTVIYYFVDGNDEPPIPLPDSDPVIVPSGAYNLS